MKMKHIKNLGKFYADLVDGKKGLLKTITLFCVPLLLL
jgi:hypothetical protein